MQTDLGLPASRPISRRAPSASARLGLLGRLGVGQKLALAAVVFAVPTVVTVSLLVSEQRQATSVASQEQVGIDYLLPLSDLLIQLQKHRRSSVVFLQGDGSEQNVLLGQNGRIEADFASLQVIDRRVGDGYGVTTGTGKLSADWQKLRNQVAGNLISPAQSTAEHTRLLSDLAVIFTLVSNASQIALDPKQDSYYYGQLATVRLPRGLSALGLTQTLGTAALAGNQPLSEAARTEGRLDLAQARSLQGDIAEAVNYGSVGVSDRVRQQNRAAYDSYEASTRRLFAAFEEQILAPRTPTVSAEAFKRLSVASFEAQSNFSDQVLETLGSSIQARRAALERNRLNILALTALALLLALALLTAITRAITRPLGRLTGASQRLASGDLTVQLPVSTRDEVGTVSTAFNTAVMQLRENEAKNVEDRVQAAKLQTNIGDFLDVTMDIAGGDLTRRGRVSDDVLGNVVDSINVMVEELAQVLRSVQSASQSVTGGSVTMLGATTDIQAGAELTATETGRVAAQVQTMIGQIRDMAQNAQASATSARQALLASEQGQRAVAGTLDGMQNIRREVQGVSRRIKGLGDRSLEIQEIVDTISQIASQTNLLALNAAIEAAGAGEAGSRFAVVADEVRKLADSSAQATSRIAGLIRTVQSEIQDVVLSVEDGTREVEQGYRVAGTAGERLREIGELTQQSARLAESISGASQAQVQGMEQVGGAVQEIASIADRSRDSVERGRAAAEQLQTLANGLNVGLSRFRLPG